MNVRRIAKLLPLGFLAAAPQIQVIVQSPSLGGMLNILALLVSVTSLTFIAVLLIIGVKEPLF